jgi:hypothetical protein
LPTFPSTAYGFIRQGSARPDGAFNVIGFAEKPAQDKAEELLLSGTALWCVPRWLPTTWLKPKNILYSNFTATSST